MPSINLRQLRDTKQLKAWLAAGLVVELRERNRRVGTIMPESQELKRPTPAKWPDFEARLKHNFGDRVLPVVEDLIEDRNSRF